MTFNNIKKESGGKKRYRIDKISHNSQETIEDKDCCNGTNWKGQRDRVTRGDTWRICYIFVCPAQRQNY